VTADDELFRALDTPLQRVPRLIAIGRTTPAAGEETA
jgi:hypothetical protein